ncbi:hypothetical protein [Entomobacter blattae]|uniref:Uncharacterized protein n=1 Tax=Entomobacter blattae TaxID=2762277 RepID=A0A7H1NS56_9PROT|nr:hypothetical protein [Entomobacter blattae]QNT78616.1 hypothetical protein JGUZn3_13910 [Entomobacter blattae]
MKIQKLQIGKIAGIVITLGIIMAENISQTYAADSYMAQALCFNGKNLLLGQTLMLRQGGIPIAEAKKPIYNMINANPDYQNFMIESVNFLYKNPDDLKKSLLNGKWTELCIHYVQGY